MPLAEHPEYLRILARLQRELARAVPFQAHVFRMINPRFSSDADILSGVGGLRADGRWNVKDRFRCSYTSQTPETAMQEVLVATRRKGLPDEKALPRTLVALDLDAQRTLDLTDGAARLRCRIGRKRILGEKWWIENQNGREAFTQAVGRAAKAAGFEAIRMPSAADAPRGVNAVVFPENLRKGSRWIVLTPLP